MTVVIIVILSLCLLYVLALNGRHKKDFTPFNSYDFAHRGLHNKPEIPENSIAAFKRAIDNGFGMEFDVHLLKDGGLAVFHDDTLIRTTGKEGRINDLSLSDLENYKLEGTSEHIPTFQEVLSVVDGAVPLIIELKYSKGCTEKLCKGVMEELDSYKGVYCIESFDPRIILWFKKNRPEVIRGQLSQNFLKQESNLSFPIRAVLTSLIANFLTRPDFVAYNFTERNNVFNSICKKFWRIKGVTWTVRNKEDFEKAKKEGYLVIFENFIP